MLKKLVKAIAILFGLSLVVFIPFTCSVIKKADVKNAIELSYNQVDEEEIEFEEGALVLKRDFNTFRAFSSDKRYAKVIEKNLNSISNTEYEISETFQLAPLKRNTCNITRCLQYKVPFSQIPLILSKGLIGIEDYRFLEHFGVDPISILRAIVYDIKAGKLIQGGSTLTQQLAKNLFFTNEKSFIRKVKEAVISIYLEMKYEKAEILQTYFNEVFWGSLQGIRIKGVQSASMVYFGKKVEELRPYEVSILVSMLKGPYYYHPIKRTQRLRKRADFIFNKLKDLGLYNIKNESMWSESDWRAWVDRLESLVSRQSLEAIYISESNHNPKHQYKNYMLVLASKKMLTNKSEISKDLSVKAYFGNIKDKTQYYSRFERSLNKAMKEERHQIGSTIKPIIYSLATDMGVKMSDMIDVTPLEMNLISGKWRPRESHQVNVEQMSITQTLQESLNTPVIRTVRGIGFDKFEVRMSELIPQLKKPLAQYPAQLLGAVEMSLEQLFDIYTQIFTSECKKPEPNVITALYDPSKTTIRRIVDRKLRDQRFFGKTGTTNNGFDNWFVGFDGNNIYVIWTGYEGSRVDKKSMPLYGSSTSFKVFQNVLLYSGKRLGLLSCNL